MLQYVAQLLVLQADLLPVYHMLRDSVEEPSYFVCVLRVGDQNVTPKSLSKLSLKSASHRRPTEAMFLAVFLAPRSQCVP